MTITTRGWLLVSMLCVLAGCGDSNDVATENPYTPEDFIGEVDASLSPDLQARQGAIKTVLDGLMLFETDFDNLASYAPEVRFTESRESFNATGDGLYGWRFNGPPSGTDFPVTVYLGEDHQAKPTDPSERVYSVTGNGPYVIARKK